MKVVNRIKLLIILFISCILGACSNGENPNSTTINENTLIYASDIYHRINPLMDEHSEINPLLFDGLTAYNGKNEIVAGLAKEWVYDAEHYTYTFYLEEGVTWHDGEMVTTEDVKFTMEGIMNPIYVSEKAANFEDLESINIVDDYTISFQLRAPNAAFVDYMTTPILPKHLLEGEDLQESEFFRRPIGTGPYKIEDFEEGQSFTLIRNDEYYKAKAKIERIIFKFIPDDNVKALQMQTKEVDLALLAPKDAERFLQKDGYEVYQMTTADYRGILYNFNHEYWDANQEIIPAINYGIDRQAIVESVLLGHGIPAYGPLQRNIYHSENVNVYDYAPNKSIEIMEAAGFVRNEAGFFERNGAEASFVISVAYGDQVRLDIGKAASQMIQEIGIRCIVEVVQTVDWGGQMAYVIGWGSPYDADDHTYKVFASDMPSNYSGYSNPKVDESLILARQSMEESNRAEAYHKFQEEIFLDPPYTFISYLDADYVANDDIQGIDKDVVMGHGGVGVFWNIKEWTKGELE